MAAVFPAAHLESPVGASCAPDGALPGHALPVPEWGRRSPERRSDVTERHHADSERHAKPRPPRPPGRGVSARPRLRPALRTPRPALRPRGRAYPWQPRRRHAGALRRGEEPLAGAGHGVPDEVPRRHAAPGSPPRPGEPALHPHQRRVLGAAAAVREEAVRPQHGPGGTRGAKPGRSAEQPVDLCTQISCDVTLSGDDVTLSGDDVTT